MIGICEKLNLTTKGSSAPAGRYCEYMPMVSRTSWAAKSRLTPHSNSIMTTDCPSSEMDCSFLMLETVETHCSTGRVTFCSMSSDETPL